MKRLGSDGTSVKRSSAAPATEAAPVFAALGDETRLRIVGQLCHRGPQSISRLTENMHVSRQAIAKHLFVLENAGLARGARVGRESIWELRPARLDDIRRYLNDISTQWDGALERLRSFIEK